MKQFDELIKNTKKISLTQSEKSLMHSHVTSHMKSHPFLHTQNVPSPYVSAFQKLRHHSLATALVLLFCLASVGTVSAESTLPGDALYGLKTGVNEKVLGWFAQSKSSKAEWQLSLADRRLHESELLAKENRLTPEVKAVLQSEFTKSTNEALGGEGESYSSLDKVKTRLGSEVTHDNFSVPPGAGVRMMRIMKSSQEAGISTSTSTEIPSATSSITKEKLAALRARLEKTKKGVEDQRETLTHNRQFIKVKSGVLVSQKLIIDSEEALKGGDARQALDLYQKAEAGLDISEPVIEIQSASTTKVSEVHTQGLQSEGQSKPDSASTNIKTDFTIIPGL